MCWDSLWLQKSASANIEGIIILISVWESPASVLSASPFSLCPLWSSTVRWKPRSLHLLAHPWHFLCPVFKLLMAVLRNSCESGKCGWAAVRHQSVQVTWSPLIVSDEISTQLIWVFFPWQGWQKPNLNSQCCDSKRVLEFFHFCCSLMFLPPNPLCYSFCIFFETRGTSSWGSCAGCSRNRSFCVAILTISESTGNSGSEKQASFRTLTI